MIAWGDLLAATALADLTAGGLVMVGVGLALVGLAIKKGHEPLLLVPLGFGIIVGNLPAPAGMALGAHEAGSLLSLLYTGVENGLYPPLVFLGIGAMTDFTPLLAAPRLVVLGAAAQVGIFATLLAALALGFSPREAGAIGIIGGADGPTAIFFGARLAPALLSVVALAAYSCVVLIPLMQPPLMRLLTTRRERRIRMRPGRRVRRLEKIAFPVAGILVSALVAPGCLPLAGMLFFGNLLKESLVTERLAATIRSAFADVVSVLLGFAIGAGAQASDVLTWRAGQIFALGAVSFAVATISGVLTAKAMNLLVRDKVNPLIGAAGVSAAPDSARVVQLVGQREDPSNFLLMHAMAPNLAGVIGSLIAAGALWSLLVSP